MDAEILVDIAGRPRSPATLPGYHAGRPPRNKGRHYPADPPTVEDDRRGDEDGRRASVRTSDAGLDRRPMARGPSDQRGPSAHRSRPRSGPGIAARSPWQGRSSARGRHGRVGWAQLRPWLEHRVALPVGPLFCIINGPTAGAPWIPTSVRAQLHRLALRAGVRRRFAPHQLRHAHAVEMAREGVPLNVIQRQLGHSDLGVTSLYLAGISNDEVITAVHARKAPVMPASAGLRFEA